MEEVQRGMTRRTFVGTMAATGVVGAIRPGEVEPAERSGAARLALTINGRRRELTVDPRTTLLDLLRENLALTSRHRRARHHGRAGGDRQRDLPRHRHARARPADQARSAAVMGMPRPAAPGAAR